MAFNENLPYFESTWQHDADARERAQNERDARDMREWEYTGGFDEARKEAAEATRMAVVRCDGSGILEEYYIDVDQSNAIACPGCFACELMPAAEVRGDERPMPDWMEPELIEFRGTRKPAAAEVRENAPARRIA